MLEHVISESGGAVRSEEEMIAAAKNLLLEMRLPSPAMLCADLPSDAGNLLVWQGMIDRAVGDDASHPDCWDQPTL
jgi:hypothetical protein